MENKDRKQKQKLRGTQCSDSYAWLAEIKAGM